MTKQIDNNRREFLKTSGKSAVIMGVLFNLPLSKMHAKMNAKNYDPTGYVAITANNNVEVTIDRVEMGQGTQTMLTMMIAEELGLDLGSVKVNQAKVEAPHSDNGGWKMMTGGSTATPQSFEEMRAVGAITRDLLERAILKIEPKTDLQKTKWQDNHAVLPNAQKLSFAKLASVAKDLKPKTIKEIKLKDPAKWEVLGKSHNRLKTETEDKINGRPIFSIDARLEGMKYAALVFPSVFGAKITKYDDKEAIKKGALKTKLLPNGEVAVIADTFYEAKEAASLIKITKEANTDFKSQSSASLIQDYKKMIGTKEDLVALKKGDVQKAQKEDKVHEYEFEFPYLAHTPMEPLNSMAHFKDGKLHVYAGSQMPKFQRDEIAKALNIKPQKIEVHNYVFGGTFGRRGVGSADFMVQSALIAKDEKFPISLIHTRESEIRSGYYRPLHYYKAKMGMRGEKLNSLDVNIVGQKIGYKTVFEDWARLKTGNELMQVEGLHDLDYEIPNARVSSVGIEEHAVPALWLRSVGHTHTAYVRESLVDEAIIKADADQIEYRKNLYKNHKRELKILDKLKEISGYKKSNKNMGIAIAKSFGSICAQAVELEEKDGIIKVKKVWVVADCGQVLNPNGATAQITGSVAFAMSYAMYGEIDIQNGVNVQSNFFDYRLITMEQMPQIKVAFIDSGLKNLGGLGEPPVPPFAPAMAAAIARMKGKRITKMPFSKSVNVG